MVELKTKTFGFFNYKYIRPQYHIEEFRSDEKHSNKYDDDAFTSSGRNAKHGEYHDEGHDSFARKHDAHGNHKAFFDSDEEDYGFKEMTYDAGYGA
ncbi:unnamed protein product [Strongylus vulgaris]|uniref:Uncharacterized protein n=1 Tax=Strongylus vulgaris TaxID=40348 RepID=A0A3P7J7I8_STRVU|nr:unnamed protein product [Strongylus vulgaris]